MVEKHYHFKKAKKHYKLAEFIGKTWKGKHKEFLHNTIDQHFDNYLEYDKIDNNPRLQVKLAKHLAEQYKRSAEAIRNVKANDDFEAKVLMLDVYKATEGTLKNAFKQYGSRLADAQFYAEVVGDKLSQVVEEQVASAVEANLQEHYEDVEDFVKEFKDYAKFEKNFPGYKLKKLDWEQGHRVVKAHGKGKIALEEILKQSLIARKVKKATAKT